MIGIARGRSCGWCVGRVHTVQDPPQNVITAAYALGGREAVEAMIEHSRREGAARNGGLVHERDYMELGDGDVEYDDMMDLPTTQEPYKIPGQ